MQTINNIIQFYSENRIDTPDISDLKEFESEISYPTEQEIFIMHKLIQQYADQHPNEMIPFNMWDGDCYHTIFKEMSAYAKEIGVDPWDAFALFLHKLDGWRMETTEDGGVAVHYGKE